jgi:hypothetical protein
MSEQIEPGDGWRLLGPDEVVRDGDEPWHRFEKRWMYGLMEVPYTAKAYHAVRRRIPAKPEAMEINNAFRVEVGSSGQLFQILQPGPPDDVGDVVIGNAIEARQLADWLTRYADWREAQESK